MQFKKAEKGTITYLTIPQLEELGARLIFTTKKKGISDISEYALNLGLNTSDPIEKIRQNYSTLCRSLNIDSSRIVFSDQVHGCDIKHIDLKDLPNEDFINTRTLHAIDGISTNLSGIWLTTLYADCIPIFFYDFRQRAVAVSHAGWKGTALRIGEKTVDFMQKNYGSRPCDILCAIGPGLCRKHFEVQKDVFNQLQKLPYSQNFCVYEREVYTVDLKLANQETLLNCGILKENIVCSELCTFEEEELFFSYRRDKGKTGRMTGMISIL